MTHSSFPAVLPVPVLQPEVGLPLVPTAKVIQPIGDPKFLQANPEDNDVLTRETNGKTADASLSQSLHINRQT